jgi:pyruvate-formate lyase-activating enzyme
MGEFMSSLKNVIEVNLMPFHQLGKDKYSRLSRKYFLTSAKTLESYNEGIEKIKEIKHMLESYDLKLSVG